MRLKIEFEMDGSIVLPYSYREKIQAFIYSAIDDGGKLHDLEIGRIKPFVFSNIIGKYNPCEKGIAFSGRCSLYFASTCFEILNDFYNFCVEKKTLSLNGEYIPLDRISQVQYKNFSGPIAYRTISPVTVYDTTNEGKSVFYNPDDRIFKKKLYENLAHKYMETFNTEMDDYINIYKVKSIKRRIVDYKGFSYEAYDLSFSADCKEKIHTLMMDLGIGNRNSIGLGMIEYNNFD